MNKALFAAIGSLPVCTSALLADCGAEHKTATPSLPTNYYPQSITPSADPRAKNGWNVFVTGDALYWTARENGLGYVMKSSGSRASTLAETHLSQNMHVKNPDFDWSWGFRVGLGYHVPHASWDLALLWTRFNNSAKDSQEVDTVIDIPDSPDPFSGEFLFPVWAHPDLYSGDAIGTLVLPILQAEAHWRVHTNVLDLELGRKFFVSKWLTVRPHMGMRAAWINQKYHVRYSTTLPDTNPLFPAVSFVYFDDIKMKNDYFGVGLRAGLDTQWGLIKELSIYGKAAIALLYGKFTLKRDEDVSLTGTMGSPFTQSADYLVKDHFHMTRATTDLAIGLVWDHFFANDRFHMALQAGWEHHIFFGQNQLMQIIGSNLEVTGRGSGSFVEYNDDLTLQGWTFGARFDF